MIKNKRNMLILGTLLSTTFLSVGQISADTLSSHSNGTVTFEKSTDGIKVLDPNDNSKEFTPGTTDGTVNKTDNIDNGLYLSYVPNFNFNTHKVNQIRDKVFFANTQAEGRPNFVQVSDLRSKNSSKWTLGVSVGAFTNTKNANDKLDGASLIFRNMMDQDVTAATNTPVAGPVSLGDKFASLMNTQNTAANATSGETVYTMAADGTSNILVKATNGTHLLTAGNQSNAAVSVGLYVPKNTQSEATYNSDITWTLALAPTAGN